MAGTNVHNCHHIYSHFSVHRVAFRIASLVLSIDPTMFWTHTFEIWVHTPTIVFRNLVACITRFVSIPFQHNQTILFNWDSVSFDPCLTPKSHYCIIPWTNLSLFLIHSGVKEKIASFWHTIFFLVGRGMKAHVCQKFIITAFF